MVSLIKPGANLLQCGGPRLETERLVLRPWQASDIAANTAMLSDAGTARFITVARKPVMTELDGWRNAAIMAGHWALYGYGMFAVEEKASARYVGRVGPWNPPEWPGFEIGWGIAPDARGRGYAVEAASAAIDWVFANFTIDRIVHCIDPENLASQGVAKRLGAVIEGRTGLIGDEVDVWVTTRERWQRRRS